MSTPLLLPALLPPYIIERPASLISNKNTTFLTAKLSLTTKMRSVSLFILSPLVGLTLYWLLTSIITKFKHARLANRLGCKPPPTLPSRDPLGINNVVRMIKSNNVGRLPHYILERNEIVSKQEDRAVFTFQMHIARNWLISTCDPKNIQAILATQFKDFQLGPVRFGTLSPL